MKVIKFFIKLTVAIIFGLAATLGVMLYLSSSAEQHARETCAAIEVGKIFDKREFFGSAAFLVDNSNPWHYSYLFFMSFDESARCNVFVDVNNIVIRTEVEIR